LTYNCRVFFLLVAIGLLSGCCCVCVAAISRRNRQSRGVTSDYPDVPLPDNGYEIPLGYHASTLSPNSHRTTNVVYALPVNHFRSEREANFVQSSMRL
uniref:Secreted protein n=1 Tax=Ascaris lumbricoides TaxID=6252 RepID=A0A0M3I6Y5_ASCLU